ncbi:Egg cell-secreted protein 1.1 [Euphorbia peplus]|nr:Egg cell-secreted protein 1.1 [Euphorbia peplus]
MTPQNLKYVLLFAFLAASLNFNNAMARSLGSNLIARLKLDEESSNCWDSLIELQACTGEIVTFFVNGETYLGPSCCKAIRTITEQCWPNLINTVGLSTEESDMLEGYCVNEANADSPPKSALDMKFQPKHALFP